MSFNLRTSSEIRFKNFLDPLQPFLAYQGFVLLDGGLATELERHGANINDILWSSKMLIENPQLIQKVHEDYVKAGADIITACSYQASFEGFEKKGINYQEARKLFELSIKLTKQAIENVWNNLKDDIDSGGTSVCNSKHRLKPLVAASLGPYGCYDGSEFEGNYGKSIEDLMNFHRPRLAALTAAEPDLVIFETVPCGNEEVIAITNLLQEPKFENVPAIISFSCKNGESTCCGEKIEDAIKIANSISHVVAAGINCTSPDFISDLLIHAKKVATKPLIVYPNSGESWNKELHTWESKPSDGISNKVKEWYLKGGARIFGGCCRTTSHDIQQIRHVLSSWIPPSPTSATEETYYETERK